MSLPKNSLSGTLPSFYGDMNSLLYFEVSSNSLSGSIPSEFETFTARSIDGFTMYLTTNRLTDYVPAWLCNISTWDVSDNLFYCPLPTCCQVGGLNPYNRCEPCKVAPSPPPPPLYNRWYFSVTIVIIVVIISLIVGAVVYWFKRRKNKVFYANIN
mmetsp:Transcript_3380/g.5146  ORF Transcript_3380/g.5146 Transcript_3380/m.5146 type:complete len:156 (-) Transcript_3380:35-502(-)